MNLTFEELITTANAFLNSGKIKKAVSYYTEAVPLADSPELKIDLLNVIGRLYTSTGKTGSAEAFFSQSLAEHENLPEEKQKQLAPNKAAVLNNLGLLSVNNDPARAVKYHIAALDIFNAVDESEKPQYKAHLANTYFSLGDAFYRKKDFFFAKKHFKNAKVLYKELSESDPETYKPLMASVEYHLGNIYNDQDALPDARMHFLNSRDLYRELTESNPQVYRPFLAAVFNNLGVVAKTMLDQKESAGYYRLALEHYKILAGENHEVYAPYLAATYNSLGILYTETEEKDKAAEHYLKAVEVYHLLSDKQPEAFTHYLATALHNLAVLYDEKQDFAKAIKYYEQALGIRKKLAEKEPGAFDADVCVTSLNLVTLYQALVEKEVDMKYKESAWELLDDIARRLEGLSDENPAVVSMKSDLDYYRGYFGTLTMEYIEVLALTGKISGMSDEVDSALNAEEKLEIQEKIIDALKNMLKKYPENERLKSELFSAWIIQSWNALRAGNPELAGRIIDSHLADRKEIPEVKINRGHIHLLSGDFEKAEKIYRDLKDRKGPDNRKYSVTILEDFDVLKREGAVDAAALRNLTKMLKT